MNAADNDKLHDFTLDEQLSGPTMRLLGQHSVQFNPAKITYSLPFQMIKHSIHCIKHCAKELMSV